MERNGEWRFEMRSLNEWAQRNMLSANKREISAQHNLLMNRMAKNTGRRNWLVAELFRINAVDLEMSSKTKGGVIRDLTELAESSGLVYDKDALYRGLVEREEAASTAVGRGCAFPHAKILDQYMFETPFIAYARASRPVFFGAPDGEPTRHFFLVCSINHSLHLSVLSRLAVLVHGTDLVERLDFAMDEGEVLKIVSECERAFCV
jgi:mannitol/fructose-specific phosphotransferase system IIA component (Ntr-type)